MHRPLACTAAAAALLLSLYACSSDSGSGDDGGAAPGEGGTSGSSRGSSGESPDAIAVTDGQTSPDGAKDAAIDGDATVDAEVDAGPPVVRFVGRFDMTPAAGPKVAWPGAQIIARFSGTEVKATFSDE